MKQNLLLISCLILLMFIGIGDARAQGGLRQTPLGFCPLSGMTSATSLTTCTGQTNFCFANGCATYAVICAYTAAVNYRDDGGIPTGTVGTGGQGLTAGQCMSYNGSFSAIQFIQQASGAILGVSFYK